MALVIPSMVVPTQNPLFVGTGESRRELKNNSDRKIAFKNCKCVEEKMTVQYAAMAPGQTDPAASFASGTGTGEFIGETVVRLSPIS
ncbi:hypothetical protein ANCCAN_12006 [Ancylostoma caninum]|uniref:MSP domain-containing protein n=1 Tax=Ancylostoma caninum TaxID=29170 RepID=A0A368GFJ8_ANCCA|nr:hypothetical protein ANCCAN_12006 [Ancylostoma caninum]